MLRATRNVCVKFCFDNLLIMISPPLFSPIITISTIPFDLISSDYDYDYNSLYLCLIL